ncbi:Translation initiation factor eIF3 subunit 135 domain-containing protein [Rozella allomycis CSF55]|uniref:Translation initiation factor eIF3 subunit 135 domain-containing protein n=1 Tax=Rozella allomycis (strain CSF55) TaxID=988480 RepID=A0A075B495_ROZAC|nr:Translation initiation factor eIF3 subunit 135 domain-containing protein [Rozella allomycis CSF55]|eukprot:EPZ35991.1 Translation initiation factor eIF3 subunit 135 domain-containing protein [Rozella allomycis CSF55]
MNHTQFIKHYQYFITSANSTCQNLIENLDVHSLVENRLIRLDGIDYFLAWDKDRDSLVESNDIQVPMSMVVDFKGFRLFAKLVSYEEKDMIWSLENSLWADNNVTNMIYDLTDTLRIQEYIFELDGRKQKSLLPIKAKIFESTSTYIEGVGKLFPIDPFPELNISRRLRPELLKCNNQPVIVDDENLNDDDCSAVNAKKMLIECVIPSLVKKLDDLEIFLLDSCTLTDEMHKYGINIRYLGIIYKLTSLPYVKEICAIEMLARTCKHLFNDKFRNAVIHFKQVKAQKPEEEMKAYVIQLLNSIIGQETDIKFWKENVNTLLAQKFGIELGVSQFTVISKAGLFDAIKYHCGLSFVDVFFDFNLKCPFASSDFIEFIPKCKILKREIDKNNQLLRLYSAVNSIPLPAKLKPNVLISKEMVNTAEYYMASGTTSFLRGIGKYEEAELYIQLAECYCPRSHAMYSLILISSLTHKIHQGLNIDDDLISSIEQTYETAVKILAYHWGPNHALFLKLNDKMVEILCRIKDISRAFEYHRKSMELSFKILGKSHRRSVEYLTKAGYLYKAIGENDKAIDSFTDSLNYSHGLENNEEISAENHYCLAETFFVMGDLESAVKHSINARDIRDKKLGPSHSLTLESLDQLSQILYSQVPKEETFVTMELEKIVILAIETFERMFKVLKNMKEPSSTKNKIEMADLTKKIVLNPVHKDLLRRLRMGLTERVFSQDFMREVVMRLVALTPNSYIDNILARMDAGDEHSITEMEAVIQIVETQNLYLQ